MKIQTLQCILIASFISMAILGCGKHRDPINPTEKCRLISFVNSRIPVYWIYNNQKELTSGNYFFPNNLEVKYIHDNYGHLTKVVSVGEHIFGDTLLAEYYYDGNRLKILKHYGRAYDMGSPRGYKCIFTCTLYYNKSAMPDSMQFTKSRIDSAGIENIQEPIRFDKFFFDNHENLVKQETYILDIDGRPTLAASNYHTYDSKPNYLKEFKQIYFQIDQSIPYIFSNNNLLYTRTEVPGKQPIEISFKIAYDGNLVVDDGMGSSEMKWSCE